MRKKHYSIHSNSQQPGIFGSRKEPMNLSSYRYPAYDSQYQPDSLERFQQEIQKSLLHRQMVRQTPMMQSKQRKKRTYTELYDSQQDNYNPRNRDQYDKSELSRLQSQIMTLKDKVQSSRNSKFEDKLDQLMQQMNKNKQVELEILRQQRNTQTTPSNVFYPPFPPYPPYYPSNNDRRGSTQYDHPRQNKFPNNRAKRLLRKYFFVVAFPVFLKSEAKRLAQRRKVSLRTFYLQKFNSQMLHLKNWLVDGLSYALPVILEKQKINLEFWLQSREQVADRKKTLLLQIVKIGLSKLRQECTSQKVLPFAEILHCICSRGSFAMSRFWSAYQMKSICISDFLGCIRADLSLQKMMICLVVMVKVLVFNMLLQPHKFDPVNFPKGKQPLSNNMHIIASVFYRLASHIIQKYIDQPRLPFYKLGNWLKVKQEFIVECCEPLSFKVDFPDEDEWISGMVTKELIELEECEEWSSLKQQMEEIVDILYSEMRKRRKDVVRNQKYKLYN